MLIALSNALRKNQDRIRIRSGAIFYGHSLFLERTEMPQKTEQTEGATVPSRISQPADDKSARVNALRAEIDSVNSEIKTTEEKEAGLVSAINEKTGSRSNYNIIQIKQLEKELEPLRQELHDVQQKKQELVQKRSSLEAEFKSLE